MKPIRTTLFVCAAGLVWPSGGCIGSGDTGGSGGATWVVETPPVTCTRLDPLDTSSPDHVIGDGTPGGLDAADLQAALDSGGTIVFDTGGQPATLVLATELILPDLGSAVMDGGGLVTFDGGLASRIIEKAWKTDLTLQRLRFENARTPQSGAAVNVKNWDGSLTVIDCEFDNCRTTSTGPDIGGGGIYASGQRHTLISGCTFTNCSGSNGGAVGSLGSQLTLMDCTFTGCTAFGTGGGADQGPTGQGGIGGAVYIDGVDLNAIEPKLTVCGCSFVGNSANDHAGAVFAYTRAGTGSSTSINATTFDGNTVLDPDGMGLAGAVYSQGSALTVTNSTFSGNSAPRSGGGLWMYSNLTSRVVDCTFFDNSVTETGAQGGALRISGTAYISSVTVAGNYAKLFGAGIRSDPGSAVWIKNSVLADNVAEDPWNGHNTYVTLGDGGGNMQWPAERSVGDQDDTPLTSTVVFADPQLGALADNGGPTKTMALPSASPAVDAGTDVDCALRDQRGRPRNGPPDVGAYER